MLSNASNDKNWRYIIFEKVFTMITYDLTKSQLVSLLKTTTYPEFNIHLVSHVCIVKPNKGKLHNEVLIGLFKKTFARLR